MTKKCRAGVGNLHRLRTGMFRHGRRVCILIVIVGIVVLADQMSRSDDAGLRTSPGMVKQLARGGGHPAHAIMVLTLIPRPPDGSRFVLKLNSGTTILRGGSDLDLICGRCSALLAEGVAPGQLPNIVLFCNNCGAFNDTEDCLPTED